MEGKTHEAGLFEKHLGHFAEVDPPGSPGVAAGRFAEMILETDLVQLLVVG
jgi:hypothetical protein